MRIGLLLGLLSASLAAQAQVIPASGRTPRSFVSAGYRLLYEGSRSSRADGDLNGDGLPDAVLALTSIEEDTTRHVSNKLPPRLLLVLWRTAACSYQLAAVGRQLLLHRNSSYMGDPYDGIAIRHGVSLVSYDVAGHGRSTTAKFRYQQGGFYLIGETNAYVTHRAACDKLPYPPRYDYRDTDYLTGEYKIIRTSE